MIRVVKGPACFDEDNVIIWFRLNRVENSSIDFRTFFGSI